MGRKPVKKMTTAIARMGRERKRENINAKNEISRAFRYCPSCGAFVGSKKRLKAHVTNAHVRWIKGDDDHEP
jgi:uncharacterized C2H2 Zn-finger protein